MTTPTDPTTPFITSQDQYAAGNKSPKIVGALKLSQLAFGIDMTDAEIDALAAQAKAMRNEYLKWETFYQQLKLRKTRLLGFQAVVLAMDVQQAAAAMHTTPQLIAGVMGTYAQAEAAKIAELEALWNAGKLPPGQVLTDPSQSVIDPDDLTDEIG